MKVKSMLYALLVSLAGSFQVLADTPPAAALDALHEAGAEADPVAFLSLLTRDAVFVGLNGNQRLEGQTLRNFVSAGFSSGRTWSYSVSQRKISLSADGTVAWFDESLAHDQQSPGWGSGVLVRDGWGWKVAQYSLSFPNPDNKPMPSVNPGQTEGHTEDITSPDNSSDAATGTAPVEPVDRPACRKLRHKTNKQARC